MGAKSSRSPGRRERTQNTFSQFTSNIFGSSSGRSTTSIRSNQTTYSAQRPWSRVSRCRWNENTLRGSIEASKTAWPVPCVEALFLPEFPVTAGVKKQEYLIKETVAKGAFGEVFRARKEGDNNDYALKVLSKAQVVREDGVRQVKEEARIQQLVGHHAFIAAAIERWQDKKRLYIVSEYIPGGELSALLDRCRRLPEELVRIYLAQLALAIEFLHNAGIIYRDLKPENVLLNAEGNLRLVDFGLSKWLSRGARTYTLCGTLKYMADQISMIDMKMEGRQVDEVVASLFHTVLFHRSCGKFLYKNEESYSIGTIGYMDVDCDYIDFTYVCCSSEALDSTIRREISDFSQQLRAKEGGSTQGAISLEFFQRRRTRWPFKPECVPWEVWTVRCAVQKMSGEDERQSARETVSELLQDRVLFITEIVNQHEYVPRMPTRSDLDLIFDTSYDDVQPYLFKMHYSLGPGTGPTVGNTVKKLIRETLARS